MDKNINEVVKKKRNQVLVEYDYVWFSLVSLRHGKASLLKSKDNKTLGSKFKK